MDNSMKLAEQIFEIENADWRQQKEWRQKGVESWALVDTFAQHISLRTSEDYLCWQLWKVQRTVYVVKLFQEVPGY